MNEFELHGRVVAQAFFLELEKIAMADPMDIVHGLRANQALRSAASPSLVQKLKPGTGSFFGAVKDKVRLHLKGRNVRKSAIKDLDSASKYTPGADDIEDNANLARAARGREAEHELHGKPGESSFFGGKKKKEPVRGHRARLRDLAFGAGIGGAGVIGTSMYLKGGQAEPGYE